jgi:hypothetical protein
MKPIAILIVLVLSFTIAPQHARADEESPNWPHVTASTTDGTAWHGGHYAKTVPAERSGEKGTTRVYRVDADKDVIVDEYDWYAHTVYLAGTHNGVSLVRMGPWNEGAQASKGALALAFYFKGKLLRSYSTLEIAGRPDNVRSTVSQYTWNKRVIGYCWVKSPGKGTLRFGFALETLDNRTICFDMNTGEIIPGGEPERY